MIPQIEHGWGLTIKKPRTLLLLAVLILGLLGIYVLLGDRISFLQKCGPYPIAESTQDNRLPQYVRKAWPAPGSTISTKCYRQTLQTESSYGYQGVGLELITNEIDDFSESYIVETELDERVELFVDGTQEYSESVTPWANAVAMVYIDSDGTEHSPNESSGYHFTWPIVLARGEHLVEVKIINNTGELFEYSWKFRIR